MDDLLIITRQKLDKHIQKMETVLTRLRDAGLKVNVAKSLQSEGRIILIIVTFFGYIFILTTIITFRN